MVVSFLTGHSGEVASEKLITSLAERLHLLQFLDGWSWIWQYVPVLVLALPGILILLLWEHAIGTAKKLCRDAGTQSWNYLRGRNEQTAGATLWTLLQLVSASLLLFVPTGALSVPLFDLQIPGQVEIRTVTEYRTKLVPVTDRIHFQKGRLRPDDRFVEEGSNLSQVAGAALQRTASSLGLGPKCDASVSLHGFASDEEFSHLGCHRNHRKNLELADHRAQAVFKKLSDLPEYEAGRLTVQEPKRWTPAINTPEDVEESWKEMSEKRNELVRQSGTSRKDPCTDQREPEEPKRNPEIDRVVVLQWTLDKACEAPAETQATEPEEKE